MERIRTMDRCQKGILLVLTVMSLIFAAIYYSTVSKTGYLYKDQILEFRMEQENRIYQAEVAGQQWCFTVTPEPSVTFRCGDQLYGPYTAREDPTAVPKDHELASRITGVEVQDQGNVIFRGGVLEFGEYGKSNRDWMIYHEDGTMAGFELYAVTGDGTVIGSNGTVIDPMEPGIHTILRLMEGPELQHKGSWLAWFGGVLLSLLTAVSMLFADELFRWKLHFRVRDSALAEPSDWEIATRYIGWIMMPLIVFALYIKGLQ